MSGMLDYSIHPISCERTEMTVPVGEGVWMKVSMLDRQIAKVSFLGSGVLEQISIEGLDEDHTSAVRLGEHYYLVAWVGAYVMMRHGEPKYLIYTVSSP
jgi:hypothetical protein